MLVVDLPYLDNVPVYAPLGPCLDVKATREENTLTVSWKDPDDLVVHGELISLWKGTKLVANPTHYPETWKDGEVIALTTVRDKYQDDPLVLEIDDHQKLFLKLFSFTNRLIYNDHEENQFISDGMFHIVFNDDYGTVYEHSFTKGVIPSCPVSVPDNPEGRSFDEWTPPVEEVTQDATYTATYCHFVRYHSDDGELIHTEQVKNGHAAAWSKVPTKAGDKTTEFVFQGWSATPNGTVDPARDNVTTDLDLYPVFEETQRLYTIRFIVEDKARQEYSLPYGEMPSYEGTIRKNTKGYDFITWVPEIMEVTKDQDYVALFKDDNDLIMERLEELENSKKELEEAQKKLQEKQDELEQSKKEIQQAQQDLQQVQNELASNQEELQNKQDDLAKSQKAFEESKKELEQAQEDLKKSQEELEKSQKEIKETQQSGSQELEDFKKEIEDNYVKERSVNSEYIISKIGYVPEDASSDFTVSFLMKLEDWVHEDSGYYAYEILPEMVGLDLFPLEDEADVQLLLDPKSTLQNSMATIETGFIHGEQTKEKVTVRAQRVPKQDLNLIIKIDYNIPNKSEE